MSTQISQFPIYSTLGTKMLYPTSMTSSNNTPKTSIDRRPSDTASIASTSTFDSVLRSKSSSSCGSTKAAKKAAKALEKERAIAAYTALHSGKESYAKGSGMQCQS